MSKWLTKSRWFSGTVSSLSEAPVASWTCRGGPNHALDRRASMTSLVFPDFLATPKKPTSSVGGDKQRSIIPHSSSLTKNCR
jgi:hypothetical protein